MLYCTGKDVVRILFDDTVKEINATEAMLAVAKALNYIDTRLVDHGERVAFIACKLLEAGNLPMNKKTLFLLSVFHDIGAYKTDEIDRMVEFETSGVLAHTRYGYLFIKYMTPLSDYAHVILHHHTPWDTLETLDFPGKDYAALIHLADRLDILFLNKDNSDLLHKLTPGTDKIFKDEYVQLAAHCAQNTNLYEQLESGNYRQSIKEWVTQLSFTSDEALEYLKMLAFSIDFRSENTVTHTVNTVAIAVNLAQRFGLSEDEIRKIELGALLHDVG